MRADFFALGIRQRLRRAHDLAHRRPREIDAGRRREVGEMQREAAHAHEHRRLEGLDERELDLRGAHVAGADPDHADLEQVRAASPHLPSRMNADRKRDVAEVARPDPHAGKRPPPGEQPIADVLVGARIEHRRAGRPARAPVFGDVGRRHQQNWRRNSAWSSCRSVSLSRIGIRRQCSGSSSLRGIDMVELAAVPRDLLRPFECNPLSLALDFPDVVARFRQRQREVHGYPEASSAVPAPPAKHQFAPTSRRRYCWLIRLAEAEQETCGVPQSASDMKPR